MKKSLQISFFFLMIAMAYVGCKKDSDVHSSISYRYAPVAVGDTLIYQVSLLSKDLNTYDSTYQLLERVESVFTDNEGRPTFRLERYVRNTAADEWKIYKVWTSNLNTTSLERKEDNTIYIKLKFPVKLNSRWNGNAKNIYANDFDDYKITVIDKPLQTDSYNFDSTLTVKQIDYDYGFEQRKHYEIYAAGVGMISKDQYDSLQGNPFGKVYHYTETLLYHNKK